MAGKGKPSSKTVEPSPKKNVGRPKSPSRNKSPSKSPGRAKSPGRPKSPSRTSPARTKSDTTKGRPPTPTRTSRVRSPARVKNASPIPKTSTPLQVTLKKSPPRRSPGRTTKETSSDKEKDIGPKKQKLIIDTDTDSDNPEYVPEIKEKPKATVRGRTRRTDIDKEEVQDLKKPDVDGAFGLIRRSTRSSQNKDVDRVVHLKHFESLTVTKRLGEFSDDDDLDKKQNELKEYVGNKNFVEFFNVYGALLLIPAIPLTVLTLYTFCTQSKCTFTGLPNLGNLKSVWTYFDAKSTLGVSAYYTLLAILTAVPAGGVKVNGPPNKYGKFDYVLNGLLSFVVLLFIFAGLQFKKIDVASYVVNHIFQILISSILFGVVVSVWAYIRSFYVPVSTLNKYAVGKKGLYSFLIGREFNPRVFSVVDLKLMFFRASLIATILIDFAYLSKSLTPQFTIDNAENTFTITPKLLTLHTTLFMFTFLHAYYFLDSLIFESSWLTSFTNQQEGFGYLLAMSYSVAPFFNTLLVKYVSENNVELATWKLVLAVLVYATGMFVYRRSNNQKDAFRKNPYSPALAHLETIPTTQGKKLLASGFWGQVRHPNYVGDIIIHLSWAPFVLCALPLVSLLISVSILVQRTFRDNAHCKLKYGAAWDRYRNRVKYALLPRVF